MLPGPSGPMWLLAIVVSCFILLRFAGVCNILSFSFLVESCGDLWSFEAIAKSNAAIAECEGATGQPPSRHVNV